MNQASVNERWLREINWSQDGLVPAIAQEAGTGRVLMVAWMNREALKATAESGTAVPVIKDPSTIYAAAAADKEGTSG